MLAGFWPVCKRGTRNLRKFVPAAYGITSFLKKLMNAAWLKCAREKLLMEV